VFEHDFGVWKLDPRPEIDADQVRDRRRDPGKLDRDPQLQFAGRRLRPRAQRPALRVFHSRRDLYRANRRGRRAPDYRQSGSRPVCGIFPRWQADRFRIGPQRPRGNLRVSSGGGEAQKVTDIDALKFFFTWSPDSGQLVFTCFRSQASPLHPWLQADHRAGCVEVWGAGQRRLVAGWKVDCLLEARLHKDHGHLCDPAEGGEEKRVTFDSASETAPVFLPTAASSTSCAAKAPGADDDPAGRQIFSIALERQAKDRRCGRSRRVRRASFERGRCRLAGFEAAHTADNADAVFGFEIMLWLRTIARSSSR